MEVEKVTRQSYCMLLCVMSSCSSPSDVQKVDLSGLCSFSALYLTPPPGKGCEDVKSMYKKTPYRTKNKSNFRVVVQEDWGWSIKLVQEYWRPRRPGDQNVLGSDDHRTRQHNRAF